MIQVILAIWMAMCACLWMVCAWLLIFVPQCDRKPGEVLMWLGCTVAHTYLLIRVGSAFCTGG